MGSSEDLAGAISSVNSDLEGEGIRLRIEQRGQRLNLRGPLPCRTTAERTRVQRISLGVQADPQGLQEARQLLHMVDLQLRRGQFDWGQWRRDRPLRDPGTAPPAAAKDLHRRERLSHQVESFEQAFFSDPMRRRSASGSRTTWTSAYRPYLRRLLKIAGDNDRELDTELLAQTLNSYADGSRSRQQCATSLGAFARHVDVSLPENWRAEAAGYGLHRARFRHLPGDAQILETVLQIPNPGWRFAFGLMATYGLRNHEVFFTDLSALAPGGDRVIRVLPTSKTGEHQVWPFHPDWVDRFGLLELGLDPKRLPAVCTDLRRTTLQQVGRRVAEQFRRYDLPLTPYDLRHAWAVRTIHIGLPDTVAARMMGHSVAIHTRTYHHWITRRDQQQAVDAALARHPA